MAVGEAFEKLIAVLARLRGPGGCPWDQEQTYQDINPYLLEEAYEVVEAIDQSDFEGLKEELGDLLVHILFHAQLATEEKKFNAADIAKGATEKLIRRHPHVFGKTKAKNTEEVLANWEKIKQKEKRKKRESILGGLPKGLPALIKAFRLGEKTSRVGFDWPDRTGILKKIKEELLELEEAIQSDRKEEIEKEYGDVLLAMANLGRFLKADPETSLRKATHTFITRFQSVEQEVRKTGKTLQDLSGAEWDRLWEKAKRGAIPQ